MGIGMGIGMRRLAWAGATAPLIGAVAVRAVRVQTSARSRRAYWVAAADRAADGAARVVTLGDSLTQGTGSSSAQSSWLGRFSRRLADDLDQPVRVENRAVYGARVADVLAEQLPLPPDAELVTLCIGSNDAGRTRPEVFRDQLTRICDQLPDGSLVGDVPTFLWGPRVGAAAQFARIVREVVDAHPRLRLAAVEKATAAARISRHLAGDYFHPNDIAYGWIAEAFWSAYRGRSAASPSVPPAEAAVDSPPLT